MFRRILVPLDRSERAERALPVAARLARASGGTIILFSVLNFPPELVSYVALQPLAMKPSVKIELAKTKDYLDHTAKKEMLAGIPVETEAVLGDAAPGILSAIDEHQSDLVVMCSHGYTGTTRWVMGSIAEKVARLSPVPIVMLREEGPEPATHEGSLQALVPLDGSERAEAAIAPAGQFVAALSAPGKGALHLLRVAILPGVDLSSYGDREGIVQAAEEYIHSTIERIRTGHLASPLADLGLTITGSVTMEDDIAAGIATVAESGESASTGEVMEDTDAVQPSQLIAMATHGYGGLHLLTMGSITGRTLLTTRLPLLIVRPPNIYRKLAEAAMRMEEVG
jgi:nucleotide-binding universal stress UspA family protein